MLTWYQRFRGLSEEWPEIHCQLIQFNKPAGLIFNEGGRWFTLSIGGRWLFFRLFLTIPFWHRDIEIMARRLN